MPKCSLVHHLQKTTLVYSRLNLSPLSACLQLIGGVTFGAAFAASGYYINVSGVPCLTESKGSPLGMIRG